MSHDPVNRPSHYTDGDIECIDAIRSALGDDGFEQWCRGNAMKYIWRAPLKGRPQEDTEKAIFYLRMSIGDDPRRPRKSYMDWADKLEAERDGPDLQTIAEIMARENPILSEEEGDPRRSDLPAGRFVRVEEEKSETHTWGGEASKDVMISRTPPS